MTLCFDHGQYEPSAGESFGFLILRPLLSILFPSIPMRLDVTNSTIIGEQYFPLQRQTCNHAHQQDATDLLRLGLFLTLPETG